VFLTRQLARTTALRLKCARGLTLPELIVAMSINTIIFLLIFSLWLAINRHVIGRQRHEILLSEARATSRSVVAMVQRSPLILYYDQDSISFISALDGDTNAIAYRDGQLLVGGEPIRLAAQTARIAAFSVENDEELTPQSMPGSTRLLRLTLTYRNAFRDSTSLALNATVRLAPPKHPLELSDE
jgi:prepilin-type N-terminal cleavage/methylation domain-containing protein